MAAEANTNTDTDYLDPLHIGNTVEIISSAYGFVTGRVVFRDATLVRVMPQEVSDRAMEFAMVGDGMEFNPDLGVTVVEVISTQESDYYVDLLGARPGETLEFFTSDGQEAAPAAEVAEVLKGPKQDAIVLTDGRTLKFRGRGPPAPIAVIRVRTALNAAASASASAEGVASEGLVIDRVAASQRQEDVLALLQSVLPVGTMEAIPMAERTFPDSLQREDLFQDLLEKVKPKQRKQPRIIRALEREVDTAVALKNLIATRDAGNRITGIASTTIESLQDAVSDGSVVPVAFPIVTAARVLHLDEHATDAATKDTDVVPRILREVLNQSDEIAKMYEEGALPDSMAKEFSSYTYDLLGRDQAVLEGKTALGWRADQDIIRTAPLALPVEGLSKNLPGTKNKENPNITETYIQSNVQERILRVLTADYILMRKSGKQTAIAPSDPDTVTAWTILPAKAALRLRPPTRPGHLPTAILYAEQLNDDNLPTVTATLKELLSPDAAMDSVWTLMADADAVPVADWLTKTLRMTVHPNDSLQPRTPAILGILDVLGLSRLDNAPSVASVLEAWVRQAQQTWRRLFKAERERIRTVLKRSAKRSFQSVTGDASPVWPALRKTAALADVLADAKRRNPSIIGAPTVITAALLTEAQGDAQPLVWTALGALDNRPVGLDEAAAVAALGSSRAYHLRRAALRGAALLGLHAEPEINSCVHVDRLEGIRSIGDVVERARMLREFVDEFQGGKREEWVTCAICTKDCVCYHDLLELEALAQPTRGEAIHRQVMVRFGGERYEGKIICRNCGQSLQDIDYDEHVEFDDEGRPIVEASVLTEEQQEEVPTESTWKKATAALMAAPVSFSSEGQRQLGEALTTILERGGMIASEAVIRQIVRYADLYVSARAPAQGAYDAQRTKLLTAASTRIKSASASASSIAIPDVPTYSALVDQLRVVALTATTAIALQVADPPIQVNNPFPMCRFSRAGWPLDPTAKPDTEGAMLYVACVVASIQRDAAPWRNVAWAAEPKIETRRKKALTVAVQAATIILGADAKSAPLSFTPEIRASLTRVQTDTAAAKERALVTVHDRLPSGFRPEPKPPANYTAAAPERNPLPNAEAATAMGTSAAPADLIAAISGAIRRQAISSVADLHAVAAAGSTGLVGTKQKDSVCCPVPLGEADMRSVLTGRRTDSVNLLAAARLLQGAQPTVSRAGTHLWIQEDSHVSESVDQAVDPSLLFQLFLKYCYTGSQVGEAHQFSTGNVCRQCGFVLGKQADLVNVATEGAGILASQQGDLRVEASPPAFEALSDAVRRRKLMEKRSVAERPTWIGGLEKLAAFLTARKSHAACGEALSAVLALIAGSGSGSGSGDDIARATVWAPLIEHMDGLRNEVADAIGPINPSGDSKFHRARARDAIQVLATFDTITEDPQIEGPRTLQEYWCAKALAAGVGFGVRSVQGAAWAKLSTDHSERINKLLRENTDWFTGDITENMRTALTALSTSLGPCLKTWIQEGIGGTTMTSGLWTIEEARIILRCLVLHVWRDAVTGSSWMFRSIPSPDDRAAAAAGIVKWSRNLMHHAKYQFVRYSKERIAQILQQRAELERTSVVEEFQSIRDDDERAAELIKKQLRMGRWGVSAKGWNKYDPDLYEFESEQRKRMGIVDAPFADPSAIAGAAGAAGAADFGFGALDAAPEAGYEVDQGAAGDDY